MNKRALLFGVRGNRILFSNCFRWTPTNECTEGCSVAEQAFDVDIIHQCSKRCNIVQYSSDFSKMHHCSTTAEADFSEKEARFSRVKYLKLCSLYVKK